MKKWAYTEKDTHIPPYLVSIEDNDSYYLVRFKGPMGRNALEANRSKMTAVIEKFDLYGKNILCDFEDVTEADTATVAALVSRLHEARPRRHKIVFFNVPERLKIFMDVTHVTPYFQISGTFEEAQRTILDPTKENKT